MRRLVTFFLFSFLCLPVFSQKTIIGPTRGVDTVATTTHIIPVQIKKNYKLARYSAVDSLLFKMDSLVRPYYSLQNNTTENEVSYQPKYRVSINEFTGDTTYIPLPKEMNVINFRPKLELDTLKIINPIGPATIDTLKKAADPVWWAYKKQFCL